MLKKTLSLAIITGILLFTGSVIRSMNFEGLKVSRIDFQGLKNTKKELLKSVLTFKSGDSYIADKISESIKELFKLGLFSQISVDASLDNDRKDSVALVFKVKEYPVVKTIKYEGMKKISTSDIDDEVKKLVPENSTYSLRKLLAVAAVIRDKYKEDGYMDTAVGMKEDLDEKDNSVRVIFVVDEGAVTTITKLSIIGCKVYTEKKLLGKMETHPKEWILHSGVFDAEKYVQDKDKLLEFYKDNGYIKAQILSNEIKTNIVTVKKGKTTKESKELAIKITVTEGEQFRFSGYTITGYAIFSSKKIWDQLKQKKGDVFNNSQFQKDIMSVQQMYAGRGYIFAQVIPDEKVSETNRTIGFDITVFEGEIAHLENIIIRGNAKTKEYVIRRELSISEGDIFDADKIRRSQEKIMNLGFFKNVNLDVKPGSAEGLMNLIIDIEEQQTGMITLGATVSSGSGLGGYEEISENNFLGKGFRIHEKVEWQTISKNYEVGFSSPWIFGTPTSFNASLNYRDSFISNNSLLSNNGITNKPYSRKEFDVNLGFGRRINDYMSAGFNYAFQYYDNYNLNPNYANNYLQMGVTAGEFQKMAISLYFEYDSRDNIYNPTKGWHFRQTFETAVGFANNDTYNKFTTDVGFYFPTFWKFVLILHGYFGIIDRSWFFPNKFYVSPTDEFLLGNSETIRGYSSAPPWGYGHSQIYYNIEYRFPIVEQMLWGLLLFDAGEQWPLAQDVRSDPSQYHYSFGLGVRIQIPMLPLRFYYSWPFDHDEANGWHLIDPRGRLDFSVGGLF